ncbi:DUF2500 domain-containing protein [Metabacillus litoralis]|uniref:DUF2500 domain-containing protein n=1 Tax=Metabacillus litoralis TaxID=152268 RepID=UPI001CFCC29A|nr:DUF2500 domain-containing protein [Metabacillus litoralis]
MGEPFFMGDLMFQIVPIFIGIIFVVVISFFIINIVKGISTYSKNEQSPRISVPAELKTKRTSVRSGGQNHHSHTSYYVTFEFSSGDRSEFIVSGKEYGQLAEGDVGILTFQGTRYGGFDRKIHEESKS